MPPRRVDPVMHFDQAKQSKPSQPRMERANPPHRSSTEVSGNSTSTALGASKAAQSVIKPV